MVGLAACSGSDADMSGPEPITQGEAEQLSEMVDSMPEEVLDREVAMPPTEDRPPATGTLTTEAEHGEVRTRSDDAVGDGVRPEGVGTVTARITSADGQICDVCLWLASEPEQRHRGLMGVTDLGDPVGMAFVWEAPTSGNFFMFGTPTPLSIAWFSPNGDFVTEADMDPCLTEDPSTCERYGPGVEYDLAIEMLDGELDEVGIGIGSSVELLAGTESPTCL